MPLSSTSLMQHIRIGGIMGVVAGVQSAKQLAALFVGVRLPPAMHGKGAQKFNRDYELFQRSLHTNYFGYLHLYKKTLFYLQFALYMANKVAILTFEKRFSKLYSSTARMTFFCYLNGFCLEGVWSTRNTCCVAECSFDGRSCYHNSCFLRRT